jgi:DNA invertase Pin-like site-specific DNA recombinase
MAIPSRNHPLTYTACRKYLAPKSDSPKLPHRYAAHSIAHLRNSAQRLLDTTTANGELVFTILAAIATYERGLISARTSEGRKRAQAKGIKFGRKSKLTTHQPAEAIQRRAAGETLTAIAKSYAVDINTISRLGEA